MTDTRPGGLQADEWMTDRLLDAVARRTGTDPGSFDRPLSDVVDPDALDALFRDGGIDGRVEFTYLDWRITVHGDGAVSVDERDG